MHLRMRLCGSRIPLPCLVCGVGVINFEFFVSAVKEKKIQEKKAFFLQKSLEIMSPRLEALTGTSKIRV